MSTTPTTSKDSLAGGGGINRRSQYIINERFQYRFIALCLLPQVLGTGVFLLLANYLFSQLTDFGQAVGLNANDQFFILLASKRADFFTDIIGILGLYLIVLFFIALLFSHKVAGPIYKMTKYLGEGSDSNTELRPLSFRPGDYFFEVAEKFNLFLKAKGLLKTATPPPEDNSSVDTSTGDRFEIK